MFSQLRSGVERFWAVTLLRFVCWQPERQSLSSLLILEMLLYGLTKNNFVDMVPFWIWAFSYNVKHINRLNNPNLSVSSRFGLFLAEDDRLPRHATECLAGQGRSAIFTEAKTSCRNSIYAICCTAVQLYVTIGIGSQVSCRLSTSTYLEHVSNFVAFQADASSMERAMQELTNMNALHKAEVMGEVSELKESIGSYISESTSLIQNKVDKSQLDRVMDSKVRRIYVHCLSGFLRS